MLNIMLRSCSGALATRIASIALIVVVDSLVAYGSPVAPAVWTSCTGCTPVIAPIMGIGSAGPSVQFSYLSEVLTNDPLNPYGLNDLDFVYQVLNNAFSTATIDSIGLPSTEFDGVLPNFPLDAVMGYFTAGVFGGTTAPNGILNGPWAGSADEIQFLFPDSAPPPNSLDPGLQSFALVIKTHATDFSSGSLIIGSGVESGTVPAFAPAVPEPGLILPLGISLLVIAAYRRVSRPLTRVQDVVQIERSATSGRELTS
jgi:hypothetical protein